MAVNINVPSQVRTFANLAAFPASGALKTIYIAEDTNKTYRWTGSVYVEVSASASGITIGTTAITSGTVGRVLFQGTGNVVSQSANLFWDNTNERLGINTSAPAYDLELRGARFYHTGKTTTATTTLYNLADNTSVNNSYLILGIDTNGSTIGLNISGSYLSAGTSGTGALRPLIIHHFNSQPIIFANSNAERMRLDASGNLLLGATNISSARGGVGTKQLIKLGASQQYLELQANTTSTTAGLLFSDGSTGNFGLVNYNSADGMEFYTAAAERMRIFSTGNLAINTTTDAGFRLDVNGTARVSGALTVSGNQILFSGSTSNTYITQNIGTGVGNLSAALCMQIQVNTFPKIIVRDTGASRASTLIVGDNVATTEAAHSSALLEVRSSSAYIRGFLPPRMTTTEKNSIPTPAAGLMVYDTTLNVISYYNGTSWI